MNVTLDYQQHGDGEPVVILHGLFGSKRNWSSIATRLATDHRVITVDLRNHGDSGHADSMTYTEMTADLSALLDSLGLDKVNLVGHSMGGKVAMVHALQAGQRTLRLFVLDIAPVHYAGNSENFSAYIAAQQAVTLAGIRSRKDAEQRLAEWIVEPGLRQFFLQNLMRDDDRFYWRINLDGIAASLAQLADFPRQPNGSPFHGPVVVLAGGASPYVQPQHHAIIYELFPNAVVDIVPGAGHWLHAEQPELVTARIRTLLQLNRDAATVESQNR